MHWHQPVFNSLHACARIDRDTLVIAQSAPPPPRFSRPGFPMVGDAENKWSSCWVLVLLLLILVSSLLVTTWIHIREGEGGIVTVVSIQPARRCTFPFVVVPVGSGDGVGDCHDAPNLSKELLIISP